MSNQASQLSPIGRLIILSIVIIITIIMWLLTPKPASTPQPSISIIPSPFEKLSDDIAFGENSDSNETETIRELDPGLESLLTQGEFNQLSERLLTLAADATHSNNPNQLADILSLLGQITIEKQSLDTAEVYFTEALDVLENTNNEHAKAKIFMHLGRTHLKSRDIARRAGYAYDALLLGRTQMNRGKDNSAEQYFSVSIEHNLSIGRTNAAASAYDSLAKLHRKTGNHEKSEQALKSSARLYAAAGQASAARHQLSKIKSNEFDKLKQEIETNLIQYEADITQIAIAKDYQRLYNHYIIEKHYQQAWHFKRLANQSLESIARRDMFYRQQGVLALLYNSNENIKKATIYLNRAGKTFNQQSKEHLSQKIETLHSEIY